MAPILKFAIGLAATGLSAWLFHGPAGYGEGLLSRLDDQVRPIVERQELAGVSAQFPRDPLARDLVFRGQANDFQRTRFVELIQEAEVDGLRSAAWDRASGGLPLFVESLIWQIGAFLFGLGIAYGMFARTARGYR